MSLNPKPASAAAPHVLEPPGGILVWIIVLVELLTFGIGIAVFLVQRNHDPEVFHHGQDHLNRALAFTNTVVLLTGGWFMANATERLRSGDSSRSSSWIAASTLTGALFMILKGIEYAGALRQGYDLHHNVFFTLYWLLTGFHFLHVLVATVLLAAMTLGIRRGKYTATHHEDVESSGIFWHMCDLIWLLLMPVVYLIG